MFILYNPNPFGRMVDDCAVRALTLALDMDWKDVHRLLSDLALKMGDMPHADDVWGAALGQHGYRRMTIPNTCPSCYTVGQFAYDHPSGIYVLGLSGHVTTVVDGNVYDTWNTLNNIPVYFWYLYGQET